MALVGSKSGKGLGLDPLGKNNRTDSRMTVPNIKVINSVFSGGADFSGKTKNLQSNAPTKPIDKMLAIKIMQSVIDGGNDKGSRPK